VIDTPTYATGQCIYCKCDMVVYYPDLELILPSSLTARPLHPDCEEECIDSRVHLFSHDMSMVVYPSKGCIVVWLEEVCE